jgi:hypothetical protein
MAEFDQNRERAQAATGEDLAALLHHHASDVLLALLDNPALSETQLCLLLERKDLPVAVLEEIGRRKPLLKNYAVKRALAFHPRTPRLISLRLLRDLYLMDLVQLTLSPGVPAELKRNAEDQLAARLPQLPLGQKITLARRGPARVAGALLAEGHAQILSVVLDNANLTEAQSHRSASLESFVAGKTSRRNHQSYFAASQMVVLLQRAPRAGASSGFNTVHRARLPSRIDCLGLAPACGTGNRPGKSSQISASRNPAQNARRQEISDEGRTLRRR